MIHEVDHMSYVHWKSADTKNQSLCSVIGTYVQQGAAKHVFLLAESKEREWTEGLWSYFPFSFQSVGMMELDI